MPTFYEYGYDYGSSHPKRKTPPRSCNRCFLRPKKCTCPVKAAK